MKLNIFFILFFCFTVGCGEGKGTVEIESIEELSPKPVELKKFGLKDNGNYGFYLIWNKESSGKYKEFEVYLEGIYIGKSFNGLIEFDAKLGQEIEVKFENGESNKFVCE